MTGKIRDSALLRFVLGMLLGPVLVIWLFFSVGLFLEPPNPCTDFCKFDTSLGFVMFLPSPVFGFLFALAFPLPSYSGTETVRRYVIVIIKITVFWILFCAWESFALGLMSEPGTATQWELGAAIGTMLYPFVLLFGVPIALEIS